MTSSIGRQSLQPAKTSVFPLCDEIFSGVIVKAALPAPLSKCLTPATDLLHLSSNGRQFGNNAFESVIIWRICNLPCSFFPRN